MDQQPPDQNQNSAPQSDQQPDNVAAARAEHFAKADFPRAPVGGKGSQPEQAEAGDEDCDPHEQGEHGSLLFDNLELLLEVVIQKMTVYDYGGREALPGTVYESERFGKMLLPHSH